MNIFRDWRMVPDTQRLWWILLGTSGVLFVQKWQVDWLEACMWLVFSLLCNAVVILVLEGIKWLLVHYEVKRKQ